MINNFQGLRHNYLKPKKDIFQFIWDLASDPYSLCAGIIRMDGMKLRWEIVDTDAI